MKAFVGLLSLVLVGGVAQAAGTPKAQPKPAAAVKPATGWAARAEQMALAVMPQEKFNEAAGFFGPVAKKYLPTFNRFRRDYEAAPEKLPVVAKYLPSAEAALADARAMKVPPKYEAKKAEYLKMIDAFMGVLRMTLKFAGYPTGAPAKK